MSQRQRVLPPIRLDFSSRQPIYLQVFTRVQALVTAGRLRPGDQLPTVRELAVHLGINFNTVARAYRLLDHAGTVSAQQGRGTYVSEGFRSAQAASNTLHQLTFAFIRTARRARFSDSQIAAAVARRLRS